MSTTIAIIGKSGSGKSTSIRSLSPESTYIFNCDGKMLPFKGWRSRYSEDKRNYKETSSIKTIKDLIPIISKEATHIKVMIIDTVNAMMIDDEMARMRVKGYDKWMDLAASIYGIIKDSNHLRKDLIIIFMFHLESYQEDDGERTKRILTNGRKLEKIHLESKFPIVLLSKSEGHDGDNNYFFETQANNSTAKSPMGMFDDFKIRNDLQFVIDKVNEYNNG
jgi:adenylate kinase family enzyme